jgi:hypothetical protein
MLARARDRTTIPALHSLLAHPSADVSRDAAAILCAMGEKVEPHEIANTNPVIFKILVNGKPLPLGFKVDWQVDRESGYVSDVVEADMHGAVAIPREQFLDPQKRPTGVALNSTVLDPADRFWFDVHLPVPRDLDVVSNVEVKVFAVHLSLGNLSKLNRPSGTKVAVQIRKKLNGETSRTSYPESEPRKFEAAVKGPVVLPLLQSGTYLLEIEMLGAARWSQAVELSPANPEITASLQPGSDVHFNVSGTAEDKVFATSTLLKDGNEFETSFDDKSRTYKSLPCGNYVLHIPSSDEIRENSMMESYQAGPDEVAYLGRDVAFTISEGSSATIDLGEIHLEAPAK